MKVSRSIAKLGKKMDGKLPDAKRKIVKKRSVNARKPGRLTRTSGKQAPQGVDPLKRKATQARRTPKSKARETSEAIGKFLGKAIGNAELIITKTVETAKGKIRAAVR